MKCIILGLFLYLKGTDTRPNILFILAGEECILIVSRGQTSCLARALCPATFRDSRSFTWSGHTGCADNLTLPLH